MATFKGAKDAYILARAAHDTARGVEEAKRTEIRAFSAKINEKHTQLAGALDEAPSNTTGVGEEERPEDYILAVVKKIKENIASLKSERGTLEDGLLLLMADTQTKLDTTRLAKIEMDAIVETMAAMLP